MNNYEYLLTSLSNDKVKELLSSFISNKKNNSMKEILIKKNTWIN